MPELPEIRALAERLDEVAAGGVFAAADVLSFSSLKTVTPRPDELVGGDRRIRAEPRQVRRDRASTTSAGCCSICRRVVASTWSRRRSPRSPAGRSCGSDSTERPSVLVKEFGKQRKVGWWVLAPGDRVRWRSSAPRYSPRGRRIAATASDNRRVHTILRDQRTICGMGRGYTDDALHAAMLSPTSQLAKLDEAARSRLYRGHPQRAGGRARGGARPNRRPAHEDRRPFTVHNRAGEPCPRCGEELRRVSYEAHEVTYCPACQTGGKVLADRRL